MRSRNLLILGCRFVRIYYESLPRTALLKVIESLSKLTGEWVLLIITFTSAFTISWMICNFKYNFQRPKISWPIEIPIFLVIILLISTLSSPWELIALQSYYRIWITENWFVPWFFYYHFISYCGNIWLGWNVP